MAHPRAKNSAREFAPVTRSFPVRFVVQRFPDHRQFCAIPEGPGPSAFTKRDGAILAYNLLTLRKPAGIVLSLLFLALLVLTSSLQAQQQSSPARVSRLLLIIPFENTSTAAGTDWISESFPEVLSTRLGPSGFFIMGRDDRLNAFDRLGIPPGAKPSRATLYQVAQQLDADYLVMGDYRVDEATITAHARLMDMERLRLSPEFTESGPLTNLISIQTALAWDILNTLSPGIIAKDYFIARFPGQRPDVLENYVRGITATNDQEKIKYFKEAVRLEPTHALAMLQLGKSYYKARDYESAASWLARIPKTDANANEAQFYLGTRIILRGTHGQSRKCLPDPCCPTPAD